MLNVIKDITIVGNDIIIPYFTKSMNLKFMLFSLRICNHMIPARDPSGVSKVVKFELIIVARLAINDEVGIVANTEDISTLIGMLLIKLPRKNENNP